jgi:hypothetical protein
LAAPYHYVRGVSSLLAAAGKLTASLLGRGIRLDGRGARGRVLAGPTRLDLFRPEKVTLR